MRLLLALLLTACGAPVAEAWPRAALTTAAHSGPVPLAEPAPPAVLPRLTVYGVAGVGTCATATDATELDSEPPGESIAAEPGAIAACWPAPPVWVEARSLGGTVRWERDTPAPTPLPPRDHAVWLVPVTR